MAGSARLATPRGGPCIELACTIEHTTCQQIFMAKVRYGKQGWPSQCCPGRNRLNQVCAEACHTELSAIGRIDGRVRAGMSLHGPKFHATSSGLEVRGAESGRQANVTCLVGHTFLLAHHAEDCKMCMKALMCRESTLLHIGARRMRQRRGERWATSHTQLVG